MAGIDFNSFFGTSSSDGSTSGASWLGEYASIKNGSYGKLAKAYYAKKSGTDEKTTKAEQKEKQQTDNRIATTADTLKSAASATIDVASLFEKKELTVTKDDGTTEKKNDYDYDAIYKAVKRFADSYNEMLTQGEKSEKTGVLSPTAHMVSATLKNSRLLTEAGITVNKDNSLSVDEDKLKSAKITTLKSLFHGKNSYADQISSKASLISNAAKNSANAKKTYKKSGTFDSNESNASGSMIDSIL